MDYLDQTKKELRIDFNRTLEEQDPLDELNDLADKKRKRAGDFKDHSRWETFRETLAEGNEGALTSRSRTELETISDLFTKDKDRLFVTAVGRGRFVTAVKLNRGLRDSNYDQLTSSNPRNQATVQDGRVVVQNVQGRQNRGQGNNSRGAGTAGYGGAQNRVGNANPGQARQVKCYNCNGIGHIARNCTQPKRPQNSEYFKDKMLLMQAQENRVALDEKQLLFLAGGQENAVDEDVDEQPVQDLALNVDNVFQADDCDAFDSDVDEAPTTQTMFMANLSSADPVYDEAGPSYDSDILSEVHDHDQYQDAVCEHHEEHKMHDDVQPNYVVDSHADYTSDSNMIPYDQYVKDNAVPVVQSNVSSVPNDAYMMIYNDMYEPHAQSVSKTTRNTVVDNSLTAELATYKEQVELYERRARFELTEREQKIDEQLRIVITDRNIKEENLKKELHSVKLQLASTINHNKSMVEEVTSLKKDFKQKENKYLEEFLDMKALKEKVEDKLYKQDQSLQTVHMLCKPKPYYDELNKITRAKHLEQITALLTKNESLKVQIQNKLSCVNKDHVKPKVLAPGKYAIDVEPIPPRNRNNREVHLVYLKHLKESVETLREIVEEAKVERPLDSSLASACLYTKHSQELLEYVIGTCPKDLNTRDNKHASTPLPKKKQVTFEEQCAMSKSNTHKPVEQLNCQKTNVLVYYVERLGHNMFIVGQFCDSDLEVAFRKHSCYVRDTDGVELIKASKNKSWLWHQHLNHLNFGTINDLARKDLVRGLPRLKFEKDHLCSACQLGKSKKHTHKPKTENTNLEVLNTLHMDLCGPMQVQTINGKKYILVIIDDYSRFTWVKFLRSKDETLEVVIKFLKQIQVGLNKTVRNIRTDNGTEFVNKDLTDYYERVGIFHQKTVPRTPQQK
ncbi:retrovirus-related pol polyprotein from transposon TNT 1-94 [Tanacetum coccineum]